MKHALDDISLHRLRATGAWCPGFPLINKLCATLGAFPLRCTYSAIRSYGR
jgi:hypothetical protein